MVTSPVANPPVTANVIRSRVLGVGGATLAAVAVWAIAVPVLGVHLAIRFGDADAQNVGFGLVVIASLIGSSAGLGLLVAVAMTLMKIVPAIPGHFTMYEWIALGIWILLGAISHRRKANAVVS